MGTKERESGDHRRVTKRFKYNLTFGPGRQAMTGGDALCPSMVQIAVTCRSSVERGRMHRLFHRLFHKHL
jgi:hypothetical protein